MNKYILLIFCLASVSGFAQRTCATTDKMAQKMIDPAFAAYHEAVMDQIHSSAESSNKQNATSAPSAVITIPVVFHILYKNATQNISDAQINSQLAILNNDYRKLNNDFNSVVPAIFRPFAADMELVFVKANRTPAGQPTDGIVRKAVANDFNFYDNYYTAEGDLAWNTRNYLNIWIGNFNDPQVLGFALLPSSAGDADDGLCISYKCIGNTGTAVPPFNKGRTATHEIGHYFGLYHPWGQDFSLCGNANNSDRVADTPATSDPYYDCPVFPNDANACNFTEGGSMFMNYMEYVNDGCMAFFTNGQKTVVQNTLANQRLSLLSSPGILSTADLNAVRAISVYPNPAAGRFMIASSQITVDFIEIYNGAGQLVHSQNLSPTSNYIDIESFESGVYFMRIYSDGKFLKSDKVIKK